MIVSEKKDDGDSFGEENEDQEEKEILQMVHNQNKKKKKSGGFQAMGLSHAIYTAVIRKGYKLPTPIQRKAIPMIMEGRDTVAMARTGSGKTAAFLLPMLDRLKGHSEMGARALIMSPTRELALQTLKFTKELGKLTDLRAAVILGGDRMQDQFAALHQNPDIIIATPGRLLHVLVEMKKRLSEVRFVVLDEADRLFEMGFSEQLTEILQRVPESRQTCLFSATLPRSLVSFTHAGLSNPTLIRLDVDSKLSPQLRISFLACVPTDKEAALVYLLRHVVPEGHQTAVFVATKHHVEYLNLLLSQCGIRCTYVYSDLNQTARKIHLAKFVERRAQVLVATDLAARGIDVPLLDCVINFHFPGKPKLFVHRVGRVARAGRSGVAYSLVSTNEIGHLVDLHVFLGRSVRTVAWADGKTEDDDDGHFGRIPQDVLLEPAEEVDMVSGQSVELTSLRKVCDNAYKQYLKCCPLASAESVKRGKQLVKAGFCHHPMFVMPTDGAEAFQQHVKSVLRNYRGKATIFEINASAKKKSVAVMRTKRLAHDGVIQKVRENSSSGEHGAASPLVSSAHVSASDVVRDSSQAVIGEDSSGEAGDRMSRRRRAQPSVGERITKKAKVNVGTRDEENYVSYKSGNCLREQGYEVGAVYGFRSDVHHAVMDVIGDDSVNIHKMSGARRWDRKRKKFVTDPQDGKAKKVQTESGNWIPASYQSNIYRKWSSRMKVDVGGDGDATMQQRKVKGMQVLGTMERARGKWHTQDGSQKGCRPDERQTKHGLKGRKSELKSKDTILKDRRQKAKRAAFQKRRRHRRSKNNTGGKR